MNEVKYWMSLGNRDNYETNECDPPITMPAKYWTAFRQGFRAGSRGQYFRKSWKKYGIIA
jgi:hypothetical protein